MTVEEIEAFLAEHEEELILSHCCEGKVLEVKDHKFCLGELYKDQVWISTKTSGSIDIRIDTEIGKGLKALITKFCKTVGEKQDKEKTEESKKRLEEAKV
jgi:hypothetical protein